MGSAKPRKKRTQAGGAAKRSRAEQREETRRKLLRLARREFAKRGFAGLSTEGLVARAGLTRGALYHLFEDKLALFRAVLEEAQAEIVAEIEAAAADAPDAWEGLRAGCIAFLDAASRPGLSRIVLLDGPAVLGWEEWRRIDAENGIRSLQEGLAELQQSGLIAPEDPEALAFMLSGAMNEGALWISAARDRAAALKHASATMDALLAGLQPSPGNPA